MAGAALSVGVLAASAMLIGGFAAVGGAASASQHAAAAADATALAAADTASGAVSGDPCERAAEVADANGASLRECALDGLVATVEVAVRWGPLTVPAGARAGPPPPTG